MIRDLCFTFVLKISFEQRMSTDKIQMRKKLFSVFLTSECAFAMESLTEILFK